MVTVLPSSVRPPFSRVGISAARTGTGCASTSKFQTGLSHNSRVINEKYISVYMGLRLSGSCVNVMVTVPLAVAGGSVAAAGSVAAGSVDPGASVMAGGASVAGAAPPHAVKIILASTTSDSKRYRLRFTVLLLRE